MDWIEELRKSQGDKVRLVGFEEEGHEHWGFIVGEVYEIKNRFGDSCPSFFGKFDDGATDYSPSNNWAEWQFVRAAPKQMVNK